MEDFSRHRAKLDQEIAEAVESVGCFVFSVVDPEEKEPSFSYSVGINTSAGAPDVIVFALRPNLAGQVINEYNRRIRAGDIFCRGVLYSGFLNGFKVYLEPVFKNRNAPFTLGCDRFYQGKP